jgi:hypothetical protein
MLGVTDREKSDVRSRPSNATPGDLVKIEREIQVVRKSGESISVTLVLGEPYQAATGEWACPVGLHGLIDNKLSPARGVDALQCLLLAQKYLRLMLEAETEKGGVIMWLGESISLTELFAI